MREKLENELKHGVTSYLLEDYELTFCKIYKQKRGSKPKSKKNQVHAIDEEKDVDHSKGSTLKMVFLITLLLDVNDDHDDSASSPIPQKDKLW